MAIEWVVLVAIVSIGVGLGLGVLLPFGRGSGKAKIGELEDQLEQGLRAQTGG